MPAPERRLLFTCEHGGNRVPRELRTLFAGRRRLLESHRAWDPGALLVARHLARSTNAPLVSATTTRLLVDLNRSPHNPRVFSALTRGLPREERELLLERHHRPHWSRVRAQIGARPGTTVHVAVHSFTPVLDGRPRRFAIGILYDPKRARERRLAIAWQRRLGEHLPRTELRRNAPYRGDADGLTAALRRELPAARYLGLELELNQRAIATRAKLRALAGALGRTLQAALKEG